MKTRIALAALAALVAGQGNAANFAPHYYQQVPKPGPGPCIQCGAQIRPNLGDTITVNPKTNVPMTVYKAPSASASR